MEAKIQGEISDEKADSNFDDRGWESDMFSADLGLFREKYRSKSLLSS